MAKVVDNFNNAAHRRPGLLDQRRQGQPEYAKFQTAISAKKGAPDVIMLEADQLAASRSRTLVDLGRTAPTTSRRLQSTAPGRTSRGRRGLRDPGRRRPDGADLPHRRLRAVQHDRAEDLGRVQAEAPEGQGRPAARFFGDFGSNVPAVTTALMIQKGAQPVRLRPRRTSRTSPSSSTTRHQGRAGLLGRPGPSRGWSARTGSAPPTHTGLVGGKYATYVSAGWAPGLPDQRRQEAPTRASRGAAAAVGRRATRSATGAARRSR